jgi:hypothetical protein
MPTPTLTCGQLVEAVQLFKELGSKTEAGKKLGISHGAFQHRLRTAKERGLTRTEPQEANQEPISHCVIPDCQVKPGVPLDHLKWAGQYIVEKRPDVIVCLGDFADMESLSSYDKGKRSAENKRYKADLEAAHRGMEMLMEPIVYAKDYKPRLVMILGNHEDRITRYADDNPVMHESVSIKDLGYEAWGWEVVPFRKVIKINGISYCHYFYNQNTSKPYGGANLDTRLKTIGMSFTMGHQQGLSVALRELADGTRHRGLVAGSFYQHSESYRGPQACSEWRGIIFKHEVQDGDYDLMEVSLNYLKRRYAQNAA